MNGPKSVPTSLAFCLFVSATLIILFTLKAGAQTRTGTVRGTVQRENGAPVPGVWVIIEHVEIGVSYKEDSNVRGQFEFADLYPGTYEFKISPGTLVILRPRQVQLREGQVLDVTLMVGPAARSTGPDPPATAAEPASVGSRISESQLVGLPLNGRSYSQLATLRSEVSDPFGGSASRGVGSGGLTIAGGRSTSNNFLMDGTNIMDSDNRLPRSAAGVQLGLDTVLQVQVFSGHYGAEYGRGSGGVLNSITRSGTPEFHGTFFEFFRNSQLDARNFFDPGPQPTPFKRNQFGFTLTGPLRNDQTFFTVSFEGLRDRLTETVVDFFPDELARQGILTDADGNVIETVTVHSNVRPYLALYPLPNSSRVGRGLGENRAPQFLPTDEDFLSTRVDHKISEKDSFFARYTLDDASSYTRLTNHLFRRRDESRQQYLTLLESHIFNPSRLNRFRFGFTRPMGNGKAFSAIEIPPSLFFVPDAPQFGQILIAGATPFGPLPGTPLAKVMNSFQYADDLLMQRAAHTLKLGVEIHRYQWDVFNNFQRSSRWSFSSLESFLRAGAERTTSLDVALPGSDNRRDYRQSLVGFYVQDDYRVRPNLQLNLGLRYEWITVIGERQGKSAALPDPVRDTQPRVGPILKNNPSLRNFSPRAGINWAVGGSRKSVLSAGFGIYYDQMLEYIAEEQKNSVPFYEIAVRTNFDSSTTFPDAVAAAQGVPLLARTFDYERTATPMVLRYTFALQQELPEGWQFRASYGGARGNHLFRSYEINLFPVPVLRADGSFFFPPDAGPINPAFGSVGFIGSEAQSFYNSLQLSASQRVARGISLQVSYTYGKSVDDASEHSFRDRGTTQYGPMRTLERGLSDFDIRHRLVLNFLYDLPWGSGRRWLNSGFLAPVLGDWRLGSILSLRAGTPFSPEINVRTPAYLFAATRPNLLPGRSNNPTRGETAGCAGVPAGRKLGSPDLYFDPCAYAVPAPGTLGNAGRNTILGPSVFSLDLSLQKDFALDTKRRLQFRAEFFNLPNHPNFNPRGGTPPFVFTGVSGRRNPTAAKIRGTATTARQIQFALRLSF